MVDIYCQHSVNKFSVIYELNVIQFINELNNIAVSCAVEDSYIAR